MHASYDRSRIAFVVDREWKRATIVTCHGNGGETVNGRLPIVNSLALPGYPTTFVLQRSSGVYLVYGQGCTRRSVLMPTMKNVPKKTSKRRYNK